MEKYRKILLLSIKIGLGSSIAILIAQALNLEYAVSAGTVTLLLAWVIFTFDIHIWIGYGILLTLVVFIAESFGLRATISVNSVVAAHLVSGQDLSLVAIRNEFLLVLIGVVIAIICFRYRRLSAAPAS